MNFTHETPLCPGQRRSTQGAHALAIRIDLVPQRTVPQVVLARVVQPGLGSTPPADDALFLAGPDLLRCRDSGTLASAHHSTARSGGYQWSRLRSPPPDLVSLRFDDQAPMPEDYPKSSDDSQADDRFLAQDGDKNRKCRLRCKLDGAHMHGGLHLRAVSKGPGNVEIWRTIGGVSQPQIWLCGHRSPCRAVLPSCESYLRSSAGRASRGIDR